MKENVIKCIIHKLPKIKPGKHTNSPFKNLTSSRFLFTFDRRIYNNNAGG